MFTTLISTPYNFTEKIPFRVESFFRNYNKGRRTLFLNRESIFFKYKEKLKKWQKLGIKRNKIRANIYKKCNLSK